MRILLACYAGMSTSLLVEKMKEAATAQGKTYTIRAVDQSMIEQEIGSFDVLLLGPQISHMLKKVSKLLDGKAPIAVIKAVDYGRCHGANVLKQAEELYINYQEGR